MTACNTPRKRGRAKLKGPEVTSKVRRSTRQSVKTNGFRLEPMRDRPTPKKKARSAKPREDQDATTPHTPVSTLQQVGRQLEIPEGELAVERLEASPKQGKDSEVNDD